MRTTFLILLTANLLFLAWAKWIDNGDEVGTPRTLSRLPRLQLVTEAPAGPKLNPGATQKMVFRSDPGSARRCVSVGPFNDITSTARAAGALNNLGFQLQQRAEEGETIEGYWVFVGGVDSDDEVAHMVDRLEKSGFTDAHIIKNFSTTRRVSVGMFSKHERAEKRAAALQHMGLQAEVVERKFPGTVYWVDVTLATHDKPLPPEYIFSEIGRSKIVMEPCPPAVRPVEPASPAPGEENDGASRLPRTTVASAPSRP